MAKDPSKYTEEELEALFRLIYLGEITPRNLPQDLFEAISLRLSDAVVKGFGNGDIVEESADLIAHFDRNVAVFSAAKTHQQVVDMSLKLVDKDGLKVPFSAFKKAARSIFDEYNVNWLETEYRTAFNNALAARQWVDFQADADITPLLRYDTANDERVREEHKELDQIVRPINDPFWRRWYPPNGWNCRCDVSAYEEGEAQVTPDNVINGLDPPDEMFDFNPAIDKQIFDLHRHPYMKVNDRYRTLKENDFNLPLPPEPNA